MMTTERRPMVLPLVLLVALWLVLMGIGYALVFRDDRTPPRPIRAHPPTR